MSDVKDDATPDFSKFGIAPVGNPPKALMVCIPIETYVNQGPDGMDMFYGKMKRVEAVGATMIKNLWAKKQANGIVTPANGIKLDVH